MMQMSTVTIQMTMGGSAQVEVAHKIARPDRSARK